MLENLSDEQEELILAGLQAVSKHVSEKEGEMAHREFMEKLAQDENLLKRFSEMLEKYKNKNGGQQQHMGAMNRSGGVGGHMGGSGANYPHIF